MIDVKFMVGGREVSPDRFGNEIEKVTFKLVKEKISKNLSSVRCPEHGQYPKVVVKGNTLKDLKFEVHGCCQKLIDSAKEKLK